MHNYYAFSHVIILVSWLPKISMCMRVSHSLLGQRGFPRLDHRNFFRYKEYVDILLAFFVQSKFVDEEEGKLHYEKSSLPKHFTYNPELGSLIIHACKENDPTHLISGGSGG